MGYHQKGPVVSKQKNQWFLEPINLLKGINLETNDKNDLLDILVLWLYFFGALCQEQKQKN